MAAARHRLKFNCTACQTLCQHVGAAVSLVLENKMALGLAAPPEERVPMETLSQQELVELALGERQERARTEKFRLRSAEPEVPWTDYTISSAASGKTYRVALRGEERGDSFCSCPDFRTNTLGTCKHILYCSDRVRRAIPGRGAAEALSQPRGVRTRALRRGSHAPPATAPTADRGPG